MAALSLRTQIAAVFTALLVATAVLLSLMLGERARQRIESDASLTLYVMTDNLARNIASDLHQISNEIIVTADTSALWQQGLTSEHARMTLSRLQATRPDYGWIGLIDTRGIVRLATEDRRQGEDVSHESWFQAGSKGPHVNDDAALSPKQATPGAQTAHYLALSTPVRDGTRTLGVLSAHVRWDWLRQVIDALQPPLSYSFQLQVFVFNRQGELIYAPDGLLPQLRAAGQRLPFAPGNTDENYGAPKQRQGGLPARVVTWQDGQAYLTTAARLQALNAASDLGWTVVARMPQRLAYADARTALLQSLGLGLGIALLGGLMTWFASGRISADLRAITAAMQNVQAEHGQTGNRIPVRHSSAEARVLSHSLHNMLDRLLSAREEMEATIRLRTSELEAANFALTRQARTDALTGLLNRRGFEDQARQIMAAARRGHLPLSLVMFDVDHFKRVNDSLGHDVGDIALKNLATTLRQRLRGADVLARFGGEEFVALLPDTDLAGAHALAEELVQAVAREEHEPYGRITISAGVATLRDAKADTPIDLHALLRRADAALYEAKGQGRNRVCVDPASLPPEA